MQTPNSELRHPKSHTKRVIAHIDMDCFYCSVEEKHHPELKGKPVIVGGLKGRGVVSASNYKAREFGVFSAMPGKKAKRLCPQGNFLSTNMSLYRKESDKVMQILNSFSDKMIQASVDEAYLDLTEFSKKFKTLEKMAQFIKNEVYKKTQLTCSIGIAKCKVTAKIASDFNKPNGYTVVENQKEFLAPLDVKKIPGIGKKSVSKYNKKGIKTIGDLAKADAFTLMDIGGKHAVEYKKIANGTKQVQLPKKEKRKSVSLEKTFSANQLNKYRLLEAIDMMSEKIHAKINNKFFKTVSIKLRDSSFKTITRDHSFSNPTNSLTKMKEGAKEIFEKAYDEDSPIRLIGVKVTNFIQDSKNQSTLDNF